MDRAEDIADLEKMLNDGEGDVELNAQARRILDRIWAEAEQCFDALEAGDSSQVDRLTREADDFNAVLKEIKRRRREHVLDPFDAYLESCVDSLDDEDDGF